MVGDSFGARPVLTEVATGCSGTSPGGNSGWADDESGLGKAAEAGVGSGDEDASADCCAFTLNVRSKQLATTQHQVRMNPP